MRLGLPFLLCAIVASLHYSTEAERFSNSRYLLGKALLRRAREINETRSNGDELEDEMSEEERERILQTEAAEDIFVGSGNHVYESQGKSETSGSRRDETSGDEGKQIEESGSDDDAPSSGDSGEGDRSDDDESDDDDDEEKSEDDDDDDGTETKKEQESSSDEATSGSGLIENESAARRSEVVSGSGSGSAQQDDNSDQSWSGGSSVEALTPPSASGDEASGVAVQSSASNEEETAFRKSEIATAFGESEDEEDDSGSAEVIKKGIESLSRLLTPVASGYEFELYSGSAAKQNKEEDSQSEGESEKGVSSDAEEVHVKQCKRVCEDPMTYEQCAVPRCDYKMGTIKDLCIYLCKHQTPVCKGSKEDELEIFSMARNALIIPMALISLVAMYHVVEMCSAKPRHRALIISRVSMFIFMVKMTYYTLLSRGYGLAFQNQRCYDLRPIYGTRYAGWTFAVPTIVFMNLYPLMDEHRLIDVLIRLFPQLAASLTYCWAAGLGCILYDPWMGWFLCILACVAYLAIIVDEIAFVGEYISTTSQPVLKGISIGIKEVMFVLYTLVYLLGNWGFMSSYAVQAFYSATDIGHIAVMSSLLFLYWNVDDVKRSGKPDHQD